MNAKMLCLGALTFGEASGYQIRKLFEDGPFAHFYDVGFGSIYPALGQAMAEGLVTCTSTAQERRPAKKVYRLTEAGRRAFKKALAQSPSRDKVRSDSLLLLFFADLMDEERLEATFEGYLAHFKDNAAKLRSLDNTGVAPGRRFVRGMGQTLYEAMARYMETHRHELLADAGRGAPRPAKRRAGAGR